VNISSSNVCKFFLLETDMSATSLVNESSSNSLSS